MSRAFAVIGFRAIGFVFFYFAVRIIEEFPLDFVMLCFAGLFYVASIDFYAASVDANRRLTK